MPDISGFASNRWAWLVAGVLALAAGIGSSMLFDTEISREELLELGYFQFEAPRPIRISSLLDDAGNVLVREEFLGHWSLIFFGYTSCPDICPVTLQQLKAAIGHLTVDQQAALRVYLVTVDPDQDDPDRLRAYLDAFDSGYRGISGELAQLAMFANELNAMFAKVPGTEPESYVVDHSARISLLDSAGDYHGFIKMPQATQTISQILSLMVQ